MKLALAMIVGTAAATAIAGGPSVDGALPHAGIRIPVAPPPHASPVTRRDAHSAIGARGISTAALTEVVQHYCTSCHNDKTPKGNLSLESYDVDAAYDRLATSEKMIRKLRAAIMPPPGSRRPGGDSLVALVETLENVIDNKEPPNPGTRPFQRLNRPEYENAIRDLVGVEINAADYLPLDTKSANFDNIADVQAMSPTLLVSYLNAAAAVSVMALGDRHAPSTLTTYTASPFVSQHPWDHVEGAPFGTRGGIVAMHVFPADGLYSFRLNVGAGVGTRLEDVDVSVNGERVALLHYEKGVERALASADAPGGADYIRTEPIFIRAGQQRVSAAFVRRGEGPYEDLIKPHDWSQASHGTGSAGTTEPPHLWEMAITGPTHVTGVSETPSRRMVLSCHPAGAEAQRACADRIITRLGTRAYRRPLTAHDRDGLMGFYKRGAAAGGFEEGIRSALQAMLASPFFVFRFENAPPSIRPGQDYQLGDFDLASRLSFFLWGSIPDDRLISLAQQHQLSDKKTLEREVQRMLADPRAEALSTRFASQWLRLQDLDKVRPDAFWFPDFDQQLADAMRRETQLFFWSVVRENRSILDLFTADYTFVNAPLARHYGIPNVSGDEFQRVQYPDSTRRGLLGHGSILVQTSLANRTSPVLRGKWVMEVLIGMPPPPPPPNVPSLDETQDAKDGRLLTTRERMALHRKNATCNACHQYMDPIGLALDNFDVTGKWRYRENGVALDTRGQMYDGTAVTSPNDLTQALLKRPIPLVRSFTENLMAYALGRRIEDFDQPTVRAIAREAETSGYRFSSIILGVVNSSAFRSKRADNVADDHGGPDGSQR
jgi:uncharacterized protein DUF1592/uncharacterized protein DUF1588/uncharacterized protein DUF1585/uncharacterized protein DUF1587/uncharacterized protein DUF1595